MVYLIYMSKKTKVIISITVFVIAILFINFTVNNDPQLGTTFNFSLMDNPRQKMLDFGASCQTPNWQIRNRVNNFITGINLPKDLERELLNSYRIYISIPHNGYSFTM